MQIRRVTEHDAEALWRLRLTALESEPYAFGESAEEHQQTSVSTYAERLRKGGTESFVFGAFDGALLAGMTGFRRDQAKKRRHRGMIWGVFVAPPWRGQGTGRALMTATLDCAFRIPEITSVCLSVAGTQPEARRLYLACGFHPIGIEPRALRVRGEYVDEEYMVLLRDALSKPDATL